MEHASPAIRLILNPVAAKGKARRMLPRITRMMESIGLSYDTVITEHPWQASEAAEKAAEQGYEMVVAAGGDGTCNEVANGLLSYQLGRSVYSKKTAMAIIPIGRGNDFAYSAGIPTSLEDSVKLLKTGRVRDIDAARVSGGDFPEGRFFINGLGIGFEPLVNLTASKYKRISGVFSYIVAVIEIMKNYPAAVPVLMSYGDNEVVVDTQQISICNGRRMGGAFLLGPDARINDGLLDLCYVNQPVKGSLILYLVSLFFRGTQKNHEKISADLVKDIKISTRDNSGRLICHIDGEMLTTGTSELKIKTFPGSLQIISSPL